MYSHFCRTLFTFALSALFILSPLAVHAAPAGQEEGFRTASDGSSVAAVSTQTEGSVTVSMLRDIPENSTVIMEASSSGRLVKKNGRLRYRKANGQYLKSAWKTIGKKTYYFAKTTYAMTGFAYIGGKIYYFNSAGVLQHKSQTVNGKRLVMNKNGTVYSYDGKRYNVNKGQQVVNYARRFVGNPYKWGGSSLTNGADCSGFVMAVYKHFGINLPHYDASIRKCGRSVPGLSNARAGDVICYDGHVAIYMGSYKIIHAASKRQGICIGNNVRYMRIFSIRRFF